MARRKLTRFEKRLSIAVHVGMVVLIGLQIIPDWLGYYVPTIYLWLLFIPTFLGMGVLVVLVQRREPGGSRRSEK